MYKFMLPMMFACVATITAFSQTSKFDIKFQRETVLVDEKAICLLKSSESLPTSYSIQTLEGEELVSIKPVYMKVETGKREGYFLITFAETGQTIERETAPSFGRIFVKELIDTETLTPAGIDVEKERGFIRKSNLRLSESIKAKVKQ